EAAQARTQRAVDTAQPAAQCGWRCCGLLDHGHHRGDAPSSHLMTVNADPGTPLGPSRITARRTDWRPSLSRAWLSILYVPLPAPTNEASPGCGGRSRPASTGAASMPIDWSTAGVAKRASATGKPL